MPSFMTTSNVMCPLRIGHWLLLNERVEGYQLHTSYQASDTNWQKYQNFHSKDKINKYQFRFIDDVWNVDDDVWNVDWPKVRGPYIFNRYNFRQNWTFKKCHFVFHTQFKCTNNISDRKFPFSISMICVNRQSFNIKERRKCNEEKKKKKENRP